MLIGLRSGVLVPHQHCDGGAEGPALEDAREDLGPIFLGARSREPALAGAAPIQVRLDHRGIERQPRWAPVDDDADTSAVGFAEGRDAEELPEGGRHVCSLSIPGAGRDTRAPPLRGLPKTASSSLRDRHSFPQPF